MIPSFISSRATPQASGTAPMGPQRKILGGKGVIGGGKEKFGMGGKGLGKGGLKRHRYVRHVR